MPSIKNFVFCLSTSNLEERQDVSGLLSIMTPEYIPGLFSFSVFFTLLGLDDGTHELELKFRDDQNVVVMSEKTSVPYELAKVNGIPKEQLGINFALLMQNVDLKHSGLYYMDVIFNEEILATYDIYVKGKNEIK